MTTETTERTANGAPHEVGPSLDTLFHELVRRDSGIRMRAAAERQLGPLKAIVRTDHDIARIVDETIEALAVHGPKHGADVYRRGDSLVRVIRRGSGPALARTGESFAIRPLDAPSLADVLTRAIEFERFEQRGGGNWKKILPPQEVVLAILRRGDWSKLPPLTGVSEVPFLRPDGSVVQTPGYDAATGYIYFPSTTFPTVSDQPTKEDLADSLAALREVVRDFPFAQPCHESAWLAFLLTLFARPAIRGNVPLMAIDATTPGTGKGKLVDVTSVIATGHIAPKTAMPEQEEEFRKVITSIVLRGSPMAVIDNVTRTIRSSALDALLTSETWDDRVLGRSEQVSWPNCCVWVVNGNNLQFGGDTSRRTLHIRLESRHERPQDREDFAHADLVAHVLETRPRLVIAALTLLRGFYAAGAPHLGCQTWGSFEPWSRVVSHCIVWAGMPDPQESRAELAEVADTTSAALAGLVDGLARLDAKGEGLTAKAVIGLLYPPSYGREPRAPDGFEELREAIEQFAPSNGGRPPASLQFGYALRRFRRRVVRGRMLDHVLNRDGVAKWRVSIAGDAGDPIPLGANAERVSIAGDAGDPICPEAGSPAPSPAHEESKMPDTACILRGTAGDIYSSINRDPMDLWGRGPELTPAIPPSPPMPRTSIADEPSGQVEWFGDYLDLEGIDDPKGDA